MNTIEYGCTLYIDHDNIIITDEYEVMVKTITNGEETFISIGVIEDELNHFYDSRRPYPEEIKRLIYVGNNIYSYKYYTSPLSEFLDQPLDIQEKIFDNIYHVYNKYK